MQQPVEVQADQHEQIVERVAAVDVAKASGMVCTRVPHQSVPGKRTTKVWLMALAGSAQRCLSKLLSSGRGEVARFGGVGQALGPLTRGGCWSSVDHVPPDISR